MKQKPEGCSRRDFFKTTGAAGVGALLSPLAGSAQARQVDRLLASKDAKVPTRPFGRSGIDVSILSLGGMFDISANQIMLKQALRWGVTYWDTADCYQRGSEAGIGKFLARYPQERKKVFLVSKSDARDPDGISRLLDRSLERMNTTYIDLYFIHGVSSIDELNDQTRRWADRAKAQKKIRLFGFSTHSNMEQLLIDAAKLDYIDGIMLTYNYRNMHTQKMRAAVDACVKAGIGLTAMKTQAERSWHNFGREGKLGDELMDRFMKKGLTQEQARLKAVWTDRRISSLCSQMTSMNLLKANVAAALNPETLSSTDMRLLQQYAQETSDQYCGGCARICETAVGRRAPVSDIMRYHMYCQSYGRPDWARAQFGKLSPKVRRRLKSIDFSTAEARCPQHMPIARLMRQALEDFS
jgi:predicted aldo/keto reductase-like oxidoreductase